MKIIPKKNAKILVLTGLPAAQLHAKNQADRKIVFTLQRKYQKQKLYFG